MVLFVAALIVGILVSSVWCAGDIVPGRARDWWRRGRPIDANAVLLAGVIAVGTTVRFWLVPAHHAMYLDEPWYAEAACNLARLGRLALCQETWSGLACVPYGKGWGWPVIISPWTRLVGCQTSIGISLNRVLGSATVLLVAVATRCAGGRWRAGVIAAAVLAIHPVHVAWSATAETNVAAAAGLLTGLCGALLYLRTGRLCGAALAVSGFALSVVIRPESLVPALAAAVILALVAHAKPLQRLVVAGVIAVVCAGGVFSGLQLWAMNEAISGGAFFASRNIPQNVLLITQGNGWVIHGVVVLVALSAAVVVARSHRRPVVGLLLCPAIAGALVALAYDRFHERMLLGATIGLLPLCGLMFDWSAPSADAGRIRTALPGLSAGAFFLLLVLLWGPALQSASVPPETQVLETQIASRVGRLSLPADALLIAEEPPVLAAAGMTHVMATERALGNEEQLMQLVSTGRPIYFLCDMYCEAGFQGTATPPFCSRMLEHFALSPVAEETLHSRTYALYRVAGPASGGSTPSRCPRSREGGQTN